MAIDTENKRRSAQSYGGGGGIAPRADAALDEYDRRHVTVYRGPLVAVSVYLFREPAGAQYRLLVADVTGRVLAELRPKIERVSWELNGVGSLALTLSRTDGKCREDLLRFGNRVFLEFDNGLPAWGGVLTDSREWFVGGVTVAALSAEALFGWRRTARERVFENATAGAILQTVIEDANAVRPTGLAAGSIWYGGQGYSVEYHWDRVDDVVKALRETLSTGGAADVTAAESAGYIRFLVNLYERRGSNKSNVGLVEGQNIAAARVREEDTAVNVWYAAGDGSGWGETSRVYGAAADDSSVSLYDRREGSEIFEVSDQAAIDALAASLLAKNGFPRRMVGATVVDRAPARFADYDLGDGVTVQLHSMGFGGVRGLFMVTGREFFPDSGACDLVLEELI
jgi:hypothetical protein